MSINSDIEYEAWKRANALDRRAVSNLPVLPSESIAARIANAAARDAESERDEA